MNERAAPLDDATMKVGLLMESAHAQQKLAETHLEQLRAHTLGLDGVVREQIRRTLTEELAELSVEGRRAAHALRAVQRSANMRQLLWSIGVVLVCSAIPAALARFVLPSPEELAAVRAEQERLTLNVRRLEREGGKVEWRRCGEAARLCVRVERSAPSYGESADFYILKGY